MNVSEFYLLDDHGQTACMQSLAERALQRWNFKVQDLKLIKYRENAVFRATTDDGTRYAVRIHRADYHSDAELESELQWISALASHGIQVPAVVPCSDGAPFAVVSAGGVPEPRQIDVFEWVEGRQLGSAEVGLVDTSSVRHTYRTIGTLAAQLHNQATAWPVPEGFTRHAWDVQGLDRKSTRLHSSHDQNSYAVFCLKKKKRKKNKHHA